MYLFYLFIPNWHCFFRQEISSILYYSYNDKAMYIKYNNRGSIIKKRSWDSVIYITGDCHQDFRRFNMESFPEQKEMSKEDYVIICGDIGHILSELCKRKGVEIIAAECMPDHVHMFVSIPPKYSVSEIMGYLKGKSSLMIFDRHANLKYKYGNRHFWCRGYYVDTVGKNAKKIEEYVKNQMQEDLEYDQMSLKEYIDPFTGEPVNKA